jgi:arylsulfatase A-like enzyme
VADLKNNKLLYPGVWQCVWAWFALLSFTQFNWAYIATYYGDIQLRLAIALAASIALAPLTLALCGFVMGIILRRPLDSGIIRSAARLHWPLYVFFVYAFHLKPGSLGSLNSCIGSIFLIVFVIWTIIVFFRQVRMKTGSKIYENRSWIGEICAAYLKILRDIRSVPRNLPRSMFRGLLIMDGTAWALVGFHLVYFLFLSYQPVFEPLTLALTLVPALLAIALQVQLARVLALGRPRAGRVLMVFLLLLVAVCYSYAMVQKMSLDFNLIRSNWRLIFYAESMRMFLGMVPWQGWACALAVLTAVIALEVKSGFMAKVPPRDSLWPFRLALCVVLLCVLLFWPKKNSDEVVRFLRSGIGYYSSIYSDASRSGHERRYPYVRDSLPWQRCARGPRPHIFFLFIQSFNGLMVNARTPEGRLITPNFNELIKKGLYVERFYGNSIQTAKGELAVQAGVLPSIRKKVFTMMPEINVQGLPRVLEREGYGTVFYKAHSSLSFDNTGPFMKHLGFDTVLCLEKSMINKNETRIWGWGPQDDLYYEKVFEFLESSHAFRNRQRTGTPLFVTLRTVMHHVFFDFMPDSLKFLYPEPRTHYQKFVNSTYLTDRFFPVFFRELESSPFFRDYLVIIMGDHGFPAGEHGITFNEQGFYEEFFRTPFLMICPDHLEPRCVKDTAYSQIDVAPTIADFLGIQCSHHWIGTSILRGADPARPVYLMQPYMGGYAGSVRYPYKYMRQLVSREELLWDLEKDPREERNLAHEPGYKVRLALSREDYGFLLDHEVLLENNRIWPPPGHGAGR